MGMLSQNQKDRKMRKLRLLLVKLSRVALVISTLSVDFKPGQASVGSCYNKYPRRRI
jgi:hypothetical protein